MAGVRDPAFWRRFSMAVHQNDELPDRANTAASSTHPELKHSESWLDRQHKKRRKVRHCALAITLLFVATIAGIAVVLWWLSRNGWFMDKKKSS